MLMSQIFVLHNQCLKYMNIFQDLPIFFFAAWELSIYPLEYLEETKQSHGLLRLGCFNHGE